MCNEIMILFLQFIANLWSGDDYFKNMKITSSIKIKYWVPIGFKNYGL